jgi:hypothetical protein
MPTLPHHCNTGCGKEGTICLNCYRKQPISTIDVNQNIFLPHPFATATCSYCAQTKATLKVILHAHAA